MLCISVNVRQSSCVLSSLPCFCAFIGSIDPEVKLSYGETFFLLAYLHVHVCIHIPVYVNTTTQYFLALDQRWQMNGTHILRTKTTILLHTIFI